jgi:hypothetical protein
VTRKETPLCQKCGQFPAYIGPNGKVYKLCALCGWEAMQILLGLKKAQDETQDK